jgi:hypothetical protein
VEKSQRFLAACPRSRENFFNRIATRDLAHAMIDVRVVMTRRSAKKARAERPPRRFFRADFFRPAAFLFTARRARNRARDAASGAPMAA